MVALLWKIIYKQVLGRGLMGSRVDSGPPLARSRVGIIKFGPAGRPELLIFLFPKNCRKKGPRGPWGDPVDPGALWGPGGPVFLILLH